MSITIKEFTYALSPLLFHPFLKRIEDSDVGARLARGVFWVMAGAFISRGLMLVATILVARILGKTGYGELGIIQSTVAMFSVFAGFGLGLTATKHVAEFRQSDPARAGRIIGLSALFAMVFGGLIALVLFTFAPWLATNTINAPQLTDILRISALILFINALNIAQTGALSGFEAFKTIARVNLFVGLISFPILIIGAWLGGVKGAVWALAINLGVNWLINHLALRKETRCHDIPFTMKNCLCEWPVLWTFSFPAAISSIMVGPINWICNAILVNQPKGYGEMGIYNAANQWRLAILFIPAMLSQVLLPLLSSLLGESKKLLYLKVVCFNIFLNMGITSFIVLFLFYFASNIMAAYGAEFADTSNVLRILSASAILIAGNNIIGQAIASQGKMWIGCLFNSLWAVTMLSTAFFFLNFGYGALGLATATLISYLLHTLWQGTYLFCVLRLNKYYLVE